MNFQIDRCGETLCAPYSAELWTHCRPIGAAAQDISAWRVAGRCIFHDGDLSAGLATWTVRLWHIGGHSSQRGYGVGTNIELFGIEVHP